MKLLLIGALLMSLFGCIYSEERYKENFLKHLHHNTPAPYKECLVEHIRVNWNEAWETFNREKKREPRGDTDIVNFMIVKYLSVCKNKLNKTQ